MFSVSVLRASDGLLDGLRLPSSKFRPSPKPIATEGTPIARMREQMIAARPEKRSFFMHLATPPPQQSCGAASKVSPARRRPVYTPTAASLQGDADGRATPLSARRAVSWD